MQPDSQEIAANEIRLRVLRWGSVGRRPLLLAHATGFCGLVWRQVAEALAESYTVYAFDRRGHGGSERPAGGYDIATLAADAGAVVEGLGLGEVYGVGHSAGATELLLAAAEGTGRFRRIVAVEPIVPPAAWRQGAGGGARAMAEQARRRRASFESREAALAHWAERPPFERWDPAVLRDYVKCGIEETAGGGARLRCPPEVEAAVYEGVTAVDSLAALGRVECPVLVVSGDETEQYHVTMAEAAVKALLRVGKTSVTGASHFLPMEQPARVAELVWAFGAED